MNQIKIARTTIYLGDKYLREKRKKKNFDRKNKAMPFHQHSMYNGYISSELCFTLSVPVNQRVRIGQGREGKADGPYPPQGTHSCT